MNEVFIQLSIVLGIAILVSLAMKMLRQPLIIGYILTGIIIGPMMGLIADTSALEAFSHIGVALLLFLVGLGLQPRVIKEVGKVALFTGLGQIIFTTIIGYFIAILIGLNSVTAFYLGIAFSLSSTIIILRLLYKKEEQDTLYGRIAIGCLLVQDMIAIVVFIVLSSTATIGSGDFVSVILTLLLKVVLLAIVFYLLMKYITPRVDKVFAQNPEMLFIFSIGVCFVVATIFYKLNFSLELGALVAGVMLSISPYQREIAMRIQSLRDFFLVIFFITLGSHIYVDNLNEYFWMIIVFSIFILIGNPLILMLIMKASRYTTKTSFLSGISMAQISEFSLIILAMGVSLGHIPQSIIAPATLIGLVTIAISTYFISYNHQIYNKCKKPLLKFLPDVRVKKSVAKLKEKYQVILFGTHVMGSGLINQMEKMKISYLAIDHDPVLVEKQKASGKNCLYGSADDSSFLDSLPIKSAKIIISTIPQIEVNLPLLSFLKRKKKSINFICIANHFNDAERLYRNGASYVIMPPYLGRRFVVDLFKKNKFNIQKYNQEKKKHVFDLQVIENKEQFF